MFSKEIINCARESFAEKPNNENKTEKIVVRKWFSDGVKFSFSAILLDDLWIQNYETIVESQFTVCGLI